MYKIFRTRDMLFCSRALSKRATYSRTLYCIYLRSNPTAPVIEVFDDRRIIIVVAKVRQLFVYVLLLIILFFHTERVNINIMIIANLL